MQEDDLIDRSKKGDKEAFSELVIQNQSTIFNLCLRLVKDEKMAEDLTQEAFLKAYNKLNTFQKKSKFSTWLYRIAYNLCLNFLKKKKKLKEEEFKEATTISPIVEKEEFTDALTFLPYKQRVIFEMYYLKKMAQKDIASSLKVPQGTVRSRLYYAKKKLKKIYNSRSKSI